MEQVLGFDESYHHILQRDLGNRWCVGTVACLRGLSIIIIIFKRVQRILYSPTSFPSQRVQPPKNMSKSGSIFKKNRFIKFIINLSNQIKTQASMVSSPSGVQNRISFCMYFTILETVFGIFAIYWTKYKRSSFFPFYPS